jgi:hypothetical protein
MDSVSALHDFVATRPFELSFGKGEEIEVLKKGRHWTPLLLSQDSSRLLQTRQAGGMGW